MPNPTFLRTVITCLLLFVALPCAAGAEDRFEGDFDGDGFADLVVAEGNYLEEGTEVGRVRIYPGRERGVSSISVWEARGVGVDSRFGSAVAVVDVNHDGYDDLLVAAGAPGAERPIELFLGSFVGLADRAAWSGVESGLGESLGAWFEPRAEQLALLAGAKR